MYTDLCTEQERHKGPLVCRWPSRPPGQEEEEGFHPGLQARTQPGRPDWNKVRPPGVLKPAGTSGAESLRHWLGRFRPSSPESARTSGLEWEAGYPHSGSITTSLCSTTKSLFPHLITREVSPCRTSRPLPACKYPADQSPKALVDRVLRRYQALSQSLIFLRLVLLLFFLPEHLPTGV